MLFLKSTRVAPSMAVLRRAFSGIPETMKVRDEGEFSIYAEIMRPLRASALFRSRNVLIFFVLYPTRLQSFVRLVMLMF